jgi:predicted Zn-dependent protease
MSRFRVTMALAAVAAVLACATNPATGKRQLMLVSEAQEIGMGREADKEAVATYGLYPDPQVQAYVETLGKGLAARSERPSLPWSFKVVDDPAVNAFALPGGFIYVTRGIMAHVTSEAELAGVMGHEIGHVTGRHSASEMSKQELVTGGLVLGMAVKPEIAEFAGLAQTGLGLLFLKFSRDHENEADHLGLRYMTREDYDPRQMVSVMEMLDRVTREEGGSRMPDWLSTHPNPENRSTRIQAEISTTSLSGSTVRQSDYLRRVDGMVFGENPRGGFFQGNAFVHPDLRFRMTFPASFKAQNEKRAVVGVSQAQDAAIALTLAGGTSAQESARRFLSQEGIRAGRSGREWIGGLPAYAATFEAARRGGKLRGEVAFVEHGGRVFRLLGYTTASRAATYRRTFETAMRSFGPLTDTRHLEVQPRRLAIVTLERDMTLAEFMRAHPSTVKAETIAIINGIDAGQRLPGGGLAKRVVGGRLPD